MSKIRIYKSNNVPDVHIGNYYVQEGDLLYFEIKNPFINTVNTPLEGYDVIYYIINLGDFKYNVSSSSLTGIKIPAPVAGIYPVSITAVFSNNTNKTYNINENITVFKEWPRYTSNIKILNDKIDINKLPYTLDDIRIKPNEFGIADVFNSSISKLNACLNYIKNSLTIVSSKTPTKFIGWLGVHRNHPTAGIQWYTSSNTPNLSREYNNTQIEQYINIIDFKIILDNEIIILHKNKDSTFSIIYSSLQRKFNFITINDTSSFTSEAKDIQSFDVEILNTNTRAIYLADSLGNKLYKLILQIEAETISCYLDQHIGGFGDKDTPLRFYSPSQVLYDNNNIFILDVNNLCIKQLSTSLGWIYTYFIEEFNTDNPQYIQIKDNILHILTFNNKIYQIDIKTKNVLKCINLNVSDIPNKFILDNLNTFYYILYPSSIKKFNINGTYINDVDINFYNINFKDIKIDLHHNIYIGDYNRILKFIDINNTISAYDDVFNDYLWSEEDMYIKEEEYSQDWIFNRSLNRIINNINLTRKSIHSQFNVISLYTANNIIKYYSTSPITSTETTECLSLSSISGVGANEIVLSQVLNNSLEKIYHCINSLVQYITVKYSTDNVCEDNFCWSWKSTACSTVKLPSLRLCGINPISFAELTETFDNKYIKNKKWIDAYGDCCDGIPPTPSFTPRCTPSFTPTNIPTSTPQPTNTLTPTNTITSTPTPTPTITLTQTNTQTPTVSPTNTRTPTTTVSVSMTPSQTKLNLNPPNPPNPPNPSPPNPTPTASKCSLLVPVVVIIHQSPNRFNNITFSDHTVFINNTNATNGLLGSGRAWSTTTLDVSKDKGEINVGDWQRTAYMLVGHPTWSPDTAFWNAVLATCTNTTPVPINRKIVIRTCGPLGVTPTWRDFVSDNGLLDGSQSKNISMAISNLSNFRSNITQFVVKIFAIIVKADGTLSISDPTFTGASGTTNTTLDSCGQYPCLPDNSGGIKTIDCSGATATDVGTNSSVVGTPVPFTSWPNHCCKAT